MVDQDGLGRYLVRLPVLSPEEKHSLDLLRANLLDSIPVEAAGDPKEVVSDYVWRAAPGLGIGGVVDDSHEKLLYYLTRDFAGFWEVDPLVNDDHLEEISCCRFDRPVRVLHRDFSQYMFMETDVAYPSEERLQAQASQAELQAQSTASRRGAEALAFGAGPSGLIATNNGPSTVAVEYVVLRFPNGTVYPLAASAQIPSGGTAPVRELIPPGVCAPGAGTCLSKYSQIVAGNPPGSSVGVVTSLGNSFWYTY